MKIAFVYMNNVGNVGFGAGYVFASIPSHHKKAFFDTLYTPLSILSDLIVSQGFDLLCISSSTLFFPDVLQLIKQVKQRVKIPIVFGGVHAIVEGEKIRKEHPEIDFVCEGEGEEYIGSLLDLIEDVGFPLPANLAYAKPWEIKGKSIDLDSIQSFSYKLFPRVVVDEERWVYVKTSRGCPYRCTYCCNKVYLEKFGKEYIRKRSVGKVIEELKELQVQYHPGMFYFCDDMIFTDKEYVVELFETFAREMKGEKYGCMGRVESVDKEIVKVMKETGGEYLAMGVECGDEEFRKRVLHRNMSNERIEEAFRVCREAGIRTCAFNVIGWPAEEDEELCRKTVQLNKKLKADIMQVTWFYPFPGTELYKKCKEEDLIDKEVQLRSYHNGSVLKMHRCKEKNAKTYLERLA